MHAYIHTYTQISPLSCSHASLASVSAHGELLFQNVYWEKVCVRVYVCMYVCICRHVCQCVCPLRIIISECVLGKGMHVFMYVCMYMQACMSVTLLIANYYSKMCVGKRYCMYVCVCMYVYVGMYVCMYLYVGMHTHAYTHMHTKKTCLVTVS